MDIFWPSEKISPNLKYIPKLRICYPKVQSNVEFCNNVEVISIENRTQFMRKCPHPYYFLLFSIRKVVLSEAYGGIVHFLNVSSPSVIVVGRSVNITSTGTLYGAQREGIHTSRLGLYMLRSSSHEYRLNLNNRNKFVQAEFSAHKESHARTNG